MLQILDVKPRMGRKPKAQPINAWGEYLVSGMARRKINQSQLAGLTQLGKSTVSMWISGERVPEQVEDIEAVARVFSQDESEISIEIERAKVAVAQTRKIAPLKIVDLSDEDLRMIELMRTNPVEAAHRLLARAMAEQSQGSSERPTAPVDDFNLEPMEIGRKLPTVDAAPTDPATEERIRARRQREADRERHR